MDQSCIFHIIGAHTFQNAPSDLENSAGDSKGKQNGWKQKERKKEHLLNARRLSLTKPDWTHMLY